MKAMEFNCVKMQFKGALHISRGSETFDKSAEIIHADMIQSAIFACALQLYGNECAHEDFFKSFRVSSAFPFVDTVYFFPKPLADANLFGKTEAKDLKAIKKINFLPQNLFEKALNGDELKLSEFKPYDKKLHQSDVNQRVTVSRNGAADAVPFFMDRIYFAENAGLYFLLKIHNSAYETKIKAAVELLGDNGIGTDKNIGQGVFEPFFVTLNLTVPPEFSHVLNIGTYIPASKEAIPDLDNSFYSVIRRGGWIANPEDENKATLRKRSVYMFSEGSVFPVQNLEGKVVDLKPSDEISHPVWRDGRGFFVPMKIKNDKNGNK